MGELALVQAKKLSSGHVGSDSLKNCSVGINCGVFLTMFKPFPRLQGRGGVVKISSARL